MKSTNSSTNTYALNTAFDYNPKAKGFYFLLDNGIGNLPNDFFKCQIHFLKSVMWLDRETSMFSIIQIMENRNLNMTFIVSKINFNFDVTGKISYSVETHTLRTSFLNYRTFTIFLSCCLLSFSVYNLIKVVYAFASAKKKHFILGISRNSKKTDKTQRYFMILNIHNFLLFTVLLLSTYSSIRYFFDLSKLSKFGYSRYELSTNIFELLEDFENSEKLINANNFIYSIELFIMLFVIILSMGFDQSSAHITTVLFVIVYDFIIFMYIYTVLILVYTFAGISLFQRYYEGFSDFSAFVYVSFFLHRFIAQLPGKLKDILRHILLI